MVKEVIVFPFPRLSSLGHVARALKMRPRDVLHLRLSEVWAIALAGQSLEEVLDA